MGLHGQVFQPQHHTEKDGDDNDHERRDKTKVRPQRLQGYGPGSCRCLDVGIELFLTTTRHSNVSWVLPWGMFYKHRAGLVQLTDSSLARTPELTKQSRDQCGPGQNDPERQEVSQLAISAGWQGVGWDPVGYIQPSSLL